MISCENISETVFKNAMGSFGFKTSTPRADGDLAEFSITPHDNSIHLKWTARARTNLDPSDPRYEGRYRKRKTAFRSLS